LGVVNTPERNILKVVLSAYCRSWHYCWFLNFFCTKTILFSRLYFIKSRTSAW
jgi:hypothetical protein